MTIFSSSQIALTSLSASAGPAGARASIIETRIREDGGEGARIASLFGVQQTERKELSATTEPVLTPQKPKPDVAAPAPADTAAPQTPPTAPVAPVAAEPGDTAPAAESPPIPAAAPPAAPESLYSPRDTASKEFEAFTQKRFASMLRALDRLLGGSEASSTLLALYSDAKPQSVNIQTEGAVNNIRTGSGDDDVAIRAENSVKRVRTGAGNDAVAIEAGGSVRSVKTGAGDDTLVIATEARASRIRTGPGDDALTIDAARGVRTVSTGRGDDSVTIASEGRVKGVFSGSGDDAVAIEAGAIDRVRTGAGNDALTLKADVVENIKTDGRNDRRAGNDGVAIAAILARGVYTGGGNDAVAIKADVISEIDTGSGDDAITLSGGLVDDINAGDGDDTITVEAITSDFRFGLVGGGADTVAGRFANAANAYGVVAAGAGNDTIAVKVDQVIAVDAGEGDDVIDIQGGTASLRLGEDSGNDVVLVGDGAELVINTSFEGEPEVSISDDGRDLVVRFGEDQSVTIKDFGRAGAIGFAGPGEDASMLYVSPPPRLDLVV